MAHVPLAENRAKWTYFGDAFFNVALRQSATLRDAFMVARSLILKREQRNGFEPSLWQKGGRLYSPCEGSYQQLPEHKRVEMMINGEPVAEIDIKARRSGGRRFANC